MHPEGVKIVDLPLTSGTLPLLAFPTDLTPTSWYACPRTGGGYWGDYFGVTQVQDTTGAAWSVSAFSDSRPAPACEAQTTYLARPLHVASSRW